MRLVCLILCVAGLLLTLPLGLLMLIAFSDAMNVCPGNQCQDAVRIGAAAATLMAILIVASLLGLRRLRSSLRMS